MSTKRPRTRGREHFAYATIIEALTVGLYPNRMHILREFIQNAHDALGDLKRAEPLVSLAPIEITLSPPCLFVADRGIGMSRDKMREYRYLGYSEKQPGVHAGFRGIGKFSPVSACERIIVRSSRLGDPKKYEVIIDAGEMLNHHKKEKNAPLEKVLEQHSSIDEADEDPKEHYTFVEFNGIRKDSQELLNQEGIVEYLRRVAPVPYDPGFQYAKDIQSELQQLIPNFLQVDVKVNGSPVHKPFIDNHSHPQSEIVYADDSGKRIIAYAWYCGHLGRGQFQEVDPETGKSRRHPHSGLSFRVSNFTIGDELLTRRALWSTTPERAYYFFGEIHVVDSQVVPTSDRDNFEENDARAQLYERCKKIAQDLNVRANLESAERRFGEVVDEGSSLLKDTERALQTGTLEEELRGDRDFEIQKLVEDLHKRLKRTKATDLKDKTIIKKAEKVLRKGHAVRKHLRGNGHTQHVFVDIKKDLKLNPAAAAVYDAIIGVLRQEFAHNREKFEDLLKKIHAALRKGC